MALAPAENLLRRPVNLQGEFDFSDEALAEALRFDLTVLLAVE